MKHQAINLVKFKALSQRLKLPLYRTVGLLDSLWIFCQIQARDGDLSKFSALEIAGWLEWDGGDEKALIDALVETRWLDRDTKGLRVHDWDSHKPNWLKGVDASPRTKKRPPSDTPSESPSDTPSETLSATPPNLTQPNLTKESPTDSLPMVSPADEFKRIWNGADGVRRFDAWNDKRRKAFRARLKESVVVHGERRAWLGAASHALDTKFPLQCTRGSPGGWVPDVDWMLRPNTVQQIFEGKYDWTKEPKGVQAADNSTVAGNVGERGL